MLSKSVWQRAYAITQSLKVKGRNEKSPKEKSLTLKI